MDLHKNIGEELDGMGGYLECSKCKSSKPLGITEEKLLHGWDKCCGYTMTWITRKMIDESTAYGTDCRTGGCD